MINVKGIKTCTVCQQTKSIEEYYFRTDSNKYRNTCKECLKNDIENSRLKRKYGITTEEYERILKEQDGCCKICGSDSYQFHNKDKKLAVDHDHNTGKIRGLLCSPCNRGLGYFMDSKDLLKKAIEYLNHAT